MTHHPIVQCAWCGALRAGTEWWHLGIGLLREIPADRADGTRETRPVSHGACPECFARESAAALKKEKMPR